MHPQCEMCALMKSIHSLLWWQWLSLCLPCNVQSMYPRRVTQRGGEKKEAYFCIVADSSMVRTVSETSSEFLLRDGGWDLFYYFLKQCDHAYCLICTHRHTHEWRQWHITAGDGRIKHDCIQIRGMFVKMNVFVWKKKVPLFKESMCNPVC